ncbi:MAG: hypothetical protein WC729_13560 [Sphingomonas sp.]|jgi:hypothetical protein|uniref:hypothetical protein n=1 Tax=Sphingomonas sp. TaxID=28214 RepID=UPI00356970BA
MILRLISLSLAFAVPASATSVAAIRPHQPAFACSALANLLQGLATAKRPQLGGLLVGVQVSTDELGSVQWEEWEALAASLRTHNGKPDQHPMRLESLRRIDDRQDKTSAFYVATIERDRWELERYMGDDGLLMPIFEPDPHFEPRREFWIVGFLGNRIVNLREADELYRIASGEDRLDCRGPLPGRL